MALDIEVFEDKQHPGDWRVEWPGNDGLSEITLFIGEHAEYRAKMYGELCRTEQLAAWTRENAS